MGLPQPLFNLFLVFSNNSTIFTTINLQTVFTYYCRVFITLATEELVGVDKNVYANFSRFGVCCLFLVSSSGGTINQNCTYIRNPNFPSVYGSTTAVSYTIQKCSNGLDAFFFLDMALSIHTLKGAS